MYARREQVLALLLLKSMVDLHKLPVRDKKGDVYVVVETPRGSAAKLEFDPDLQLFTLSKSLILGLSYPYDWGFIPSTKGEDGDPIDALILHDAATTPGLVLKCRIIGVLEVIQTEGNKHAIRNDRLIAVPPPLAPRAGRTRRARSAQAGPFRD
jgi:inorganic pyrophosphatase